jgi:hypothetical protein
MPKLPCCTKANFYAKPAFLLLTTGLYANNSRTNYPREVYDREYTMANFYAKFCNDLGLTHIGFMTGPYPLSCIGNGFGIKPCLL